MQKERKILIRPISCLCLNKGGTTGTVFSDVTFFMTFVAFTSTLDLLFFFFSAILSNMTLLSAVVALLTLFYFSTIVPCLQSRAK